MASTIKIVDDAGEVHEHDLSPGKECPACERPVPKVKADAATGRAGTERISLTVPPGDEGLLELMLIDLVNKYKEQWPREFAAMRAGLGLEIVGGTRWRYYAIFFAVHACLNVPGLAPVEEGQ